MYFLSLGLHTLLLVQVYHLGISSFEQTYIGCHTIYPASAARSLSGVRTALTWTKCHDETPAPRLLPQGSIMKIAAVVNCDMCIGKAPATIIEFMGA
jgi:hypothetical protein